MNDPFPYFINNLSNPSNKWFSKYTLDNTAASEINYNNKRGTATRAALTNTVRPWCFQPRPKVPKTKPFFILAMM